MKSSQGIRRRFRVVCEVGVVVLGVSACSMVFGSVAQAATSPRQALIDTGDAICKASNESLLAAAKTYETHTIAKASGASTNKKKVARPADVAEFIEKFAANQLKSTIANLRALPAPVVDRTEYAGLLARTEKALETAVAKPKAAAWIDPFKNVSEAYVTFGFAVCGHKIGDAKVEKKK